MNQKEQILFEAIYKKHLHNIKFFAQSYLGNKEEAECVAQEVFLALLLKIDEYDFEKPILHYLLTITKNKCLNLLKKRKVRFNHISIDLLNIDTINAKALEKADNAILHSELETIINKSLDEMAPIIKETFLKNRYENLTYPELATFYSVTEKAIEYRMMSALRILKKNCKHYLIFVLGLIISKL